MKWGLHLGPVRPWIALLCIVLALTFVLAAFAVLALAGLVAPGDLPQFRLRRGFASWDILGQLGLLGANGLALGAMRRHWWTKSDIVSQASGNVLIVGEPKHTDAALLAAASAWRGPLVFIDTADVRIGPAGSGGHILTGGGVTLTRPVKMLQARRKPFEF